MKKELDMNNKPSTMEEREWFIQKLSMLLNIPKNTISRVVSHNYESIYMAMKDNDSVEISGFGNFYFRRDKALQKLKACYRMREGFKEKLADNNINDRQRHTTEKLFDANEVNIKELNRRGVYE